MTDISRREWLTAGLGAGAALAARAEFLPGAEPSPVGRDVQKELLDAAADFERQRRQRFAAVSTPGEFEQLQKELRTAFLNSIGGLPRKHGAPKVTVTGQIDADGYQIEKLVFESWPGFFVSTLLYRPLKFKGHAAAVLSLSGHSPVGKASDACQILNANLARRGYVVLACDPVGQAERSQFWDAAKNASPFGLACGEHAVLGNPLYLLGASLARFEIWDAMRAIDYLTSLDEVDSKKIGCVGASGGGTQTAYLSALDRRVAAAAIVCYITTLPRRMANRIEADPDADPEQDLFGFVSSGIDHAGLLALIAPRPTLVGTARFDFFPIEGARESFDEARHLYGVCGRAECVERLEVPEKHGLGRPLREAIYAWFDRWLGGSAGAATDRAELAEKPRQLKDLLVCPTGQVSRDFQSRPLLSVAWEEFTNKPKRPARSLRELLGIDLRTADPQIQTIAPLNKAGQTLVVCVNGNEGDDWRAWPEENVLLKALEGYGAAILVVDPRLVGDRRHAGKVAGHEYTDPLCGVEENLAYNAFLVGKTLLGLRVADVLAGVNKTVAEIKPGRIILCGRRDAALTALFAAAVEPQISGVAVEKMLGGFESLFRPAGQSINAANIVPGLLRNFGDIGDIIRQIGPRRVLLCAPLGPPPEAEPPIRREPRRFSAEPKLLTQWIDGLD